MDKTIVVFGDANKVVEGMVKVVEVQFSENFAGFNGMGCTANELEVVNVTNE